MPARLLPESLGSPPTFHSTLGYIESWLKPLKHDEREISRGAAHARKINNIVLAFHTALLPGKASGGPGVQ